ncbi:LytR/AlgR family response regulator transcription factor [Rhodoflexus sp.]
MKVLIVEDEPVVARQLADFLNRNGYEVVGHTLTDAETRLWISTAAQKPDLAIIDLRLSGGDINNLDGLKVADFLNQLHGIRVLFISALGSDKAILEQANKSFSSDYALVVKGHWSSLQSALIKVEEHIRRDALPAYETATITLTVNRRQKIIRLANIVYMETQPGAVGRIALMIAGEEKYKNQEHISLGGFRDRLISQFPHLNLGNVFLRIHASYIINVNYLASYNRNEVFLKGYDKAFPIGKVYKDAFLRSLGI